MIKCLCALVLCVSGWNVQAGEPGPVAVFDGKDFAGLVQRQKDQPNNWKVVSEVKLDPASDKKLLGAGSGGKPDSVLLNTAVGADLLTSRKFGDCELHAEFMMARGSNSGLFFMGQYELQVTDSTGIADSEMSEGECGGILWTAKPKCNATRPIGEWQTYDVVFRAPRFDAAGKKTENARFVKVTLNGRVVQENTEVKEPTGGGLDGPESATGPLIIQGSEGVAAYRNVRITAQP